MNNSFWNLDTIQSLVRGALKIAGGYLVARGFADDNTFEALSAGAMALLAVVWGLLHRRNPAAKPPTALLLLVASSVLLTGCATAQTTAFRSEKLAVDSAYASLQAWKAYYASAPASAALSNRNDQVFAASRAFAALVRTADALRLSCATNSAASNRAALSL